MRSDSIRSWISPRVRAHCIRESLEVVVAALPRGVHDADEAAHLARGGEPVPDLLDRAVVVAGDQERMAAVGEELQALLACAEVPVGDDDLGVDAIPRALQVAAH